MRVSSAAVAGFAAISAILASAVALPTAHNGGDDDWSQVEHSPSFRLRSRSLTAQSGKFANLYVETYHVSPAVNYAVLQHASVDTPAIVGYLNGTKGELSAGRGDLVFPLTSFPEVWIITEATETATESSNPVEISVGYGTRNMFIDQGVLKYFNPSSGGWYGESWAASHKSIASVDPGLHFPQI